MGSDGRMESCPQYEKVTKLLRPEAVESLERSGFSGRLSIRWDNGRIVSFSMRTEVSFRVHRPDEDADDGFMSDFGPF